MLRTVTLLAALAFAAAQDCDTIPAWAKQNFCRSSTKCCDAASSRRLSAAAGQGKKMSMGMFAVKAEKRMRSVASVMRAKKHQSAKMLVRWQRDGPLTNIVKVNKRNTNKEGVTATNLYDVVDDDFHKTLLDNVVKTYTMQEFFAEKYPDEDWDELEESRQDRGWTMGELMIHLYTEESPDIYRPMNKMLREATSMDDIDEYWQSYIKVLYAGMKTHAPYVVTDTYRGVSDCSSLDVLHVGDEGVMPSFTSTSTSKNAAAGFAGGCTLLHFTGGGYDIKSYSSFPGEAELLVEPGRTYTISTAEEEDGNEKFDCDTDGDSNHAVDEDADADGASGPVSCDDITAHYGDVWNDKYCPLGAACCADLYPPPVENSAADCCDCCDIGGDCDGQVCDADGEDFYCGATRTMDFQADEDDVADFKAAIGCDAAVTMASTRAAAASSATFFAGVAMVSGASFLVSAFYFGSKTSPPQIEDSEQPSLYEPLAA